MYSLCGMALEMKTAVCSTMTMDVDNCAAKSSKLASSLFATRSARSILRAYIRESNGEPSQREAKQIDPITHFHRFPHFCSTTRKFLYINEAVSLNIPIYLRTYISSPLIPAIARQSIFSLVLCNHPRLLLHLTQSLFFWCNGKLNRIDRDWSKSVTRVVSLLLRLAIVRQQTDFCGSKKISPAFHIHYR